MPRFALIALAVAALVFVAAPEPASAAVCADYADQSAAQQAKDTLDGDGDGIFCETLPCPCSPEWQAQHGSAPSTPTTPTTPPTSPRQPRTYSGRITRVIDGDTVKVKIKKKIKTVRVLGIDTPESHKPGVAPECGSAEATSAAHVWAFDKRLDYDSDGLFDHGRKGRKVKLKTDGTQSTYDKYGRLLAYVSRGPKDFGKAQVGAGWAELFVFADNPFVRLVTYQTKLDQAKAAGRGVWSLCGGDFHSNQ